MNTDPNRNRAARESTERALWYDIAFVPLHNDEGGLQWAIDTVRS